MLSASGAISASPSCGNSLFEVLSFDYPDKILQLIKLDNPLHDQNMLSI
jgi:hypothetical protein